MPDLRFWVPEWIGLCAIIVIFLSLVPYLSRSNQIQWSAGFIITLAAIFRIMFLFRLPELSDDMYRYLFDGLMLLSGKNPYTLAPAEVVAGDWLLSGLVHCVNHPELPTIYPPAAQIVFAVGAFSGSIAGMKLLLAILDLLTCILIIKLLNTFKRPVACAALYAWHPLPIIEVAGSGHIDAAAIFFLFLSFVFLFQEKQMIPVDKTLQGKPDSNISRDKLYALFAGIFFAAAMMIKWLPLIFLPGLWLLTNSGKKKSATFGFLISCAAMICVFWPDVQNCFYTLSVYAANWEFSGFAFRWLRAATGSGTISRAILAAGFVITIIIIYLRRINESRFHTSIISKIPLNLPLLKGGFSIQRLQSRYIDIFKCCYFTAMAFLFFTPTLHPWYALYLAAFLPFAAGPAGLTLSWSVFLAYRVVILFGLTGEWIENDFIPFLIVSAPVAAFAASLMLRMISRKNKPEGIVI